MIDVDTVCTHQNIVDEISSTAELGRLLGKERAGSTENDRRLILAEVLRSLTRRTPPIYEGDIGDATELTQAVTLGVCARLYRNNMTSPDGTDAARAKHYESAYVTEVRSMLITSSGGSHAGPTAIAVFRS